MTQTIRPPRLRSVWISDVHLGTPSADAAALLFFLRTYEFEHLYLVGDIIDFWEMASLACLPRSHRTAIRELRRLKRGGVNVWMIPGNHDEDLRRYFGRNFGGIPIVPSRIHTGKDGRRWLAVHGDEFDPFMKNSTLMTLSHVGSWIYNFLLGFRRSPAADSAQEQEALRKRSLAGSIKQVTKRIIKFIGRYEHKVARLVAHHKVDGIICGHIHKAELREDLVERRGFVYANCGDWVENNTALVEHPDGRMELLAMPRMVENASTLRRLELPKALIGKSYRRPAYSSKEQQHATFSPSASPSSPRA